MEATKSEIHAIQQEVQVKETTQEALGKAQQEIQVLKDEKEQLRVKMEDLMEQQKIIYESNTLSIKELEK